MGKKKKNKIFLLLILLLGITVGFAALATTLKINGNASITKNTWNIYWDNIGNEDGVTPAVGDETSIGPDENDVPLSLLTWSVTFEKPGDFYEFQVDAVNAGTIDAEILEIEKGYNGSPISAQNALPSYLTYTVVYADTGEPAVGDRLAKRTDSTHFTSKRYKIRVEYDRNAVTNSDVNNQNGDITHSFSFKVKYGQYTAPSAVAFATDPWDTIAAEGNSAATQTSVINNKCGAYEVGDTKEVDLGDLGVHTVRIANCSTPAVCNDNNFSETACGFVVEFTDIITKHRINPYDYSVTSNGNGNKGGWEYSDIRAYLNGTTYAYGNIDYSTTGIFSKLPSDLKSKIASTKVISSHSASDSTNFTTTDKLYLLSAGEVWLDNYVPIHEGERVLKDDDTAYNKTRQLDYYESNGVSTTTNQNILRKATSPEMASQQIYDYWWLRSASVRENYTGDFIMVSSNGIWNDEYSSSNYGVSPAFKLD